MSAFFPCASPITIFVHFLRGFLAGRLLFADADVRSLVDSLFLQRPDIGRFLWKLLGDSGGRSLSAGAGISSACYIWARFVAGIVCHFAGDRPYRHPSAAPSFSFVLTGAVHAGRKGTFSPVMLFPTSKRRKLPKILPSKLLFPQKETTLCEFTSLLFSDKIMTGSIYERGGNYGKSNWCRRLHGR